MANNPTIAELVAEVLTKTEEELIPWEATAEGSVFTAPMGGSYLLRVLEMSMKTGSSLYRLQIADSEGENILSANSVTYATVSTIYQKARNQALGIDRAISSVLEDLRKLKK